MFIQLEPAKLRIPVGNGQWYSKCIYAVVRRPRAIIADDHPGIRAAVGRILQPHCDVIATAADGQALLQQVSDALPDLVVTDISMPEMDGIEACRQIRRLYPSVEVIVVTGIQDADVDTLALQSGASAVVHKHEMARDLPAAVLALK